MDAPRLAEKLGATAAGGAIYVKDEGRLPTGSFKARGLVMAVSMAKELGVTRMAMPTNGNAGAALAAYCTRCGIESYTFAPEDTPECNIREMAIQGAKVWRANGYIDDCGKIVGGGKEAMGWFDTSTLKVCISFSCLWVIGHTRASRTHTKSRISCRGTKGARVGESRDCHFARGCQFRHVGAVTL